MSTDHRIEAFLESLMAERGAAANTVAAYRRDLDQFMAHAKQKKWRTNSLKRQQIEAYLSHLSQSGLSASSTARKLSCLRQFFRFLYTDGHRTDNPAATIGTPKKGRRLPKCLSGEQVDGLLEAARAMPGPEGARLVALLEMLYASGLRVSELVTLRLGHIRKNKSGPLGYEPFLVVLGKGSKERLAPLNLRAIEALDAYLQQREAFLGEKEKSPWLFPSSSADGHLTRQRFGQLLKELAIRANIDPESVSPHVIRHAFASHLLEGGADLRVIQELLGHADISTTQIYTHIASEHLKSLVEQGHPLAKAGRMQGSSQG